MNQTYKNFVENLYNGLSVLYPESIFGQKIGSRKPFADTWTDLRGKKWQRDDFAFYVLSITNTSNTDEAGEKVKEWKALADKNGEPTSDMPPQDLIERAEEIEDAKNLNNEEKKKKQQFLFQKENEGDVEKEPEPKEPEKKEVEDEKPLEKEITEKPEEAVGKVEEVEAGPEEPRPVKEAPVLPAKPSKVVYIKPKLAISPVNLTPQQEEAFNKLVESARKSPKTFAEKLSQRMVAQLPKVDPELAKAIGPKLLKIDAQHVAFEVTRRIVDGTSSFVSPWVMKPFVDPGAPELKQILPQQAERVEVARAAQEFGLVFDHDSTLVRQLFQSVVGPEITIRVLGPDERIEYEITDSPEEAYYKVDVNELRNVSQRVRESSRVLYQAIEEGDSDRVYEDSYNAFEYLVKKADWYKAGNLISRATSSSLLSGGLATIGAVQGYRAGLVVSSFIATKVPQLLSPAIGGLLAAPGASSAIVSTIFEKQIGNFGIIIVKATGARAGQAALGIGLNVGGKISATYLGPAVLARVGAILGSIAPIVGQVVGFALGWIAGKILPKLIDWFRKHKDEAVFYAVIPVAAGLAIGSIPLMALGSLFLLGALFAKAGGIVAAGRGIGGAIGNSFYGLLAAGAGSIFVSAIITFVGIAVFIAFAMFIINSGAYLVPPSASSIAGSQQSQYIDVKKEATPKGPFSNSDLTRPDGSNLEIQYKVTVSAKKGALSNISFQNTCTVTKDGTAPACTPPLPENPPAVIDSGQPYEFNYTQTYSPPGFEDSFVTDTFSVTANAEEAKNEKSASSASIKIGNPPEDCPLSWPVGAGTRITQGARTTLSHKTTESLDFGTGIGSSVLATHAGTAYVFENSCLGKYVEIQSTCQGKTFVSRYAHLSTSSVSKIGQHVNLGSQIGLSGNSGSCKTGAHLHYEFRIGLPLVNFAAGPYPNNPPFMWSPYIPKNANGVDVPRGCANDAQCGITN